MFLPSHFAKYFKYSPKAKLHTYRILNCRKSRNAAQKSQCQLHILSASYFERTWLLYNVFLL